MAGGFHTSREDYLEAILDLEQDSEEVRCTDISNLLGVSKPSVNKAMGVLKNAGLVEHQPYGSVYLTPKGREYAQEVRGRHDLIKGFLVEVLGIDSETAETDACNMEHVVSETTISKLASFVRQMRHEPMEP